MNKVKEKYYTGSRASSLIHHDTMKIESGPVPWTIRDGKMYNLLRAWQIEGAVVLICDTGERVA